MATCYLMDTSKFHGPLYFVYPLLGIIMPILACITVISNTIIIIILSRYALDVFDKVISYFERASAPGSVPLPSPAKSQSMPSSKKAKNQNIRKCRKESKHMSA